MTGRPGRLSEGEFIALIALTTAVVAFSIDAMLPSLPEIGAELDAPGAAERQLVVVGFFAGFALGPIPFGMLADAAGRRIALFAGLGLFALGAALAASAESFEALIAARALQGFAAAGPRTVAMSVVRDLRSGAALAQAMSYIMAAFIIVPALAPSIGLAIEASAGWRAVFWAMVAHAAIVALWIALRLPETLPPERRAAASPSAALRGVRAALSIPAAWLAMVASGFAGGGLVAYLGLSEAIFGAHYGFGDAFPLVFGAFALVIGASTLANARLAPRLGVERLSRIALVLQVAVSAAALAWIAAIGPLGFAGFVLWSVPTFFGFAVAFTNLNALSIDPLGAVAGVGAGLSMTISNGLGAALGAVAGAMYDGPPTPLIAVFGFGAVAALACLHLRAAAARRAHPGAVGGG